ncbi:hypothetical protein FSS13T_00020 [Flavobacterium saliperosum S13]|uniref:YhhN-like protein n=2 Tax=Flavobacterium saliperosum TaxID=329186 RepID=A0A1G4V1C4_9FLAO|nr:hypothetical protein [Flavobacterium saliperosum]ESU28543.1 hypothetical protein FSS13T_00020 [Flavobacterium saliperosum S13]SCW99684.1 hypothetical protein SAMN02927925_00001 [Flavobacterium saliperosum]
MLLGFAISLIGLFLLLRNVLLFALGLKEKNKKEQLITVYLTLLFVVELFCHIIGWTNPGNNLFLSHYYFNSQFIILSVVFYQLLENKIFRKIILFNLFAISGAVLYSYIEDPSLYYRFNIIEVSLTSAALSLYSILYLIKTLRQSESFYYFNTGLLLYLTNSLFIFLSGNTETVFIEDPYIDIWIFNSLFYILYQAFIYKNWKLIKDSKKANL